MRMIVQPAEGALDDSRQLVGGTDDRSVQTFGMGRHGQRGVAFKACFHDTAHVVLAILVMCAVFIGQMHLDPRDVFAKLTQGVLDHAADVSGQRFMTFDTAVGIDLDLQKVLLVLEMDWQTTPARSLPDAFATGRRTRKTLALLDRSVVAGKNDLDASIELPTRPRIIGGDRIVLAKSADGDSFARHAHSQQGAAYGAGAAFG